MFWQATAPHTKTGMAVGSGLWIVLSGVVRRRLRLPPGGQGGIKVCGSFKSQEFDVWQHAMPTRLSASLVMSFGHQFSAAGLLSKLGGCGGRAAGCRRHCPARQ